MASGIKKLLITAFIMVVIVFLLSVFYPFGFLKIVRWAGLLLFLLLVWFFRDPERSSPDEENNILSPADGRVTSIIIKDGKTRIAIFMSIFNVHVNRIPITGKVIEKKYTPGRYVPAFNPNCHLQNEQSEVTISNNKIKVKIIQIAGLLARKIVNNLKSNMQVVAGQRYGMIKLGSRVDIEFPASCTLECVKGQQVKAGQTVLAKIG
ncbi:MAG: phosphatidylserine decarboxylase [Candidatus Marinimicrobia bacterium]|nr:phosphatidylserine decarboxylase [Candidatus Neomarinimicrobiota bacterium]